MYAEFFKNRSVVITGGCGFIGSHVARQLVGAGAHVTLIDSLIPEYGGNLFNIHDFRKDVQVNFSDVRDVHSLEYLLKDKDFLFNLAGQTSHMDSMTDPYTDLAINSGAQLSLLETCRKVCPGVKIVFASTRQLYGRPQYLPVDEKHPIVPVDVNGINKWCGESYHILYNNVHGIKSCALRLTNTFGPGMRVKDARQTFVGIWIKSLIRGTPFEVWGGEQLRDFNYVADVVDAILMAAANDQSWGKVFNLGGAPVVSLRQLADMLISAYGAGKYVQREFPAERKKIDIGDYYSDFSLIKKTIGWSPQTGLDEAFSRTLNFYAQHLNEYTDEN